MFISAFAAFFSQIFSIVSTLFMIWMLIDCIRNQAIKRKGGWIIFILFTQFIGATVYFFTRGPWPKVRQSLFPQNSFQNYRAPRVPNDQVAPAPPPGQETFSAYERGYQVPQHSSAPASQEYVQTPEASMLQPDYEQPSITYPEMPPMQQYQE